MLNYLRDRLGSVFDTFTSHFPFLSLIQDPKLQPTKKRCQEYNCTQFLDTLLVFLVLIIS